MSRLATLTPDQLNDAQRQLYESIISGPRANPQRPGGGLAHEDGSLIGPFNAMLYAPDVGEAVQRLGAALRFQTSLPRNLLELAILVTGREWTAQFEWWAHARMAAEAGVDGAIIEAVRERRRPTFSDDDEAAVYDLCRELLDTRRVSDARYDAVRTIVGEQGVAELVMLQGYYGLVSMVLNVFEVPLPEGVEEPLTL